jgi:hypothetical protein
LLLTTKTCPTAGKPTIQRFFITRASIAISMML